MESADRVKRRGNRVRYEKDFGRVIGTRGEEGHVVVFDFIKKKIITSFPSTFE